MLLHSPSFVSVATRVFRPVGFSRPFSHLRPPRAAALEISEDEDEQRGPNDARMRRRESRQSFAIGIVRELPSWSQD